MQRSDPELFTSIFSQIFLLPRTQYFTQLVIRQSHEIVKHNGVREKLTEVRRKFWIIKGRQEVKDVLFTCVIL